MHGGIADERLGHERAQFLARRGAGADRDVLRLAVEAEDRDGPAFCLGGGDGRIGGFHACIPIGRGRPAVIDHENERSAAGRRGRGGVQDGGRQSQDDKSGKSEPQRDEPPRRARGGFFLRHDIEQQPKRREIHASGPRRDEPQQKIEGRKARQREKNPGIEECQGKTCHPASLSPRISFGRSVS
jgi:hypothetical protein